MALLETALLETALLETAAGRLGPQACVHQLAASRTQGMLVMVAELVAELVAERERHRERIGMRRATPASPAGLAPSERCYSLGDPEGQPASEGWHVIAGQEEAVGAERRASLAQARRLLAALVAAVFLGSHRRVIRA
jgi:hypothetical protein